MLDYESLLRWSENQWEQSILPSLSEFISIEALSPGFEPKWEEKGELSATLDLFQNWADIQGIEGLESHRFKLDGRTPLLIIKVKGSLPGEILFYSHMDKQPSKPDLWSDGLSPFVGKRRGEWLYGRGSIDDGYGGYLCISAIKALQAHGMDHPSATFLIETCEESGSYDLPAYLDHCTPYLGNPDLVVVMDSGGPDYDHIWKTDALRGLIHGTLSVRVSKEGVHSGMAGGAIPSSFRIARILLDRIEDSRTGKILIPSFHTEINDSHVKTAGAIAEVVGESLWGSLPVVETLEPHNTDTAQMLLDVNWRPALSVIGAGGLPPVESAGNVLRTHTDLALSLRIPPGVNSQKAMVELTEILERDPPFGAEIKFEAHPPADGFRAPPLPPNVAEELERASSSLTGKPPHTTWVGGTIPFMAMMQSKYPDSAFLCTGAAGPGNNAHGPDEKLHIPTAKRLTAAIAAVSWSVGN
ncbi:MAG: M20/M25/M40 family metallo-hydrolase [Candidatus Thermoplasmatota archaeon]|jgi:acetylornithine deacetylase/succinyl-diaminopimelate desuccinylase-like protein|nr:M20/M25/M40 family metallo-hydrolase [Candidatus Thermoplasmatota archaeon]